MADRLEIANAALSMIGEPVIRTMGENSPQAEAVKATLPIEIPAVLNTWPWDFARHEEVLDDAWNTLVGVDEPTATTTGATNGLIYDPESEDTITIVAGTDSIRRIGSTPDITSGTTAAPISLAADDYYLYLCLASGLWRMPIALTGTAELVANFPPGAVLPRAIAWGDRMLYLITARVLYSLHPNTGKLEKIGDHYLAGITDMTFKPPHLFVVTSQADGDRSIYLINRVNGNPQHVLRLPPGLGQVTGIAWDGTSLILANQSGTSTDIFSTLPTTINLNREKYFKPDDYLRVWNWPDAEEQESRFLEDGEYLRIKPVRHGRGGHNYPLRYLTSEQTEGPRRPLLAYVRDIKLMDITDSLYIELLGVRLARRIAIRFVESLQLRRELLIEEEGLGNRVTAISLSQRDQEETNVNELGRPGVVLTHQMPSRGYRDHQYG